MNGTGIVRKIDQLGRIVLPMELRRTRRIEQGDPMEILVDGDTIILKKYQPACVFCGGTERVNSHKGKPVCQGCVDALKQA